MDKKLADLLKEVLTAGRVQGTPNKGGVGSVDELLKGIMGDTSLRSGAIAGEKIALDRLRERAKAFTTEKPVFRVGEIVVAKSNSHYEGHRAPAIVIDVRPNALPVFTAGEVGGPTFGMVPDLRILCINPEGDMFPVWVESGAFEYYVPIAARG